MRADKPPPVLDVGEHKQIETKGQPRRNSVVLPVKAMANVVTTRLLPLNVT